MAPNVDLVTVKVSVNGNEKTIKMERGTSFENKGGIFTAGENNGILKMTNYQLQAFKAMANNYAEEGEDGVVLSKKDIQEAQKKYRNGEFVTDMSEFLPEGYRIEKPILVSAKNMVQASVTNVNKDESATLKFSFKDLFNNITVVNGEELHNHQTKYFAFEDGKLMLANEAKTYFYAKLPYVENGVVKLKDKDSEILCTYKNGVLLKYERTVNERICSRNNFNYVYQTPGDFQRIEFYNNGNVKSLDIKIDQYEEYAGARFTCKFDSNGCYSSGKEEKLRTDRDGISRYYMVDMSKEDYERYAERLPLLMNFED